MVENSVCIALNEFLVAFDSHFSFIVSVPISMKYARFSYAYKRNL